MKKVLVFAGAWGWGPITTAQMICETLNGTVKLTTAVSGIALKYATNNPSSFGEIIPLEELKRQDLQCDAVLSVVEPIGPLVAQCTDTSLIAIDNLFWHWRWRGINPVQVNNIIRNTRNLEDIKSTLSALRALGDYAEYSSMYFAAKDVYWQRVAGIPKSTPPWMLEHARYVQPFLGKLPKPKRITGRKFLLVSLSGGLVNPYTMPEQLDSYSRLIYLILNDTLLQFSRDYNVVVTAPEAVRKRLMEFPPQCQLVTLGRKDFLKYLSNAALILAPAGLSTTFEAAALQTPIITLPEQHDGNYSNYIGLAGIKNTTTRCLRSAFPAVTVETFGRGLDALSAERLFAFYQESLSHPETGFIPWAKAALAESIDDVMSSPNSYIARQAEILSIRQKQFGGEFAVSESILKVIGE